MSMRQRSKLGRDSEENEEEMAKKINKRQERKRKTTVKQKERVNKMKKLL